MRLVSEFRDPQLAAQLIKAMYRTSQRAVSLMEVCGTHTVAVSKNGLRQMIPSSISLLSGPGCPVCVTSNRDLDKAIAVARQPGVILTTFGDMMRVPGSYSSLSNERAEGRDVRVVYSTMDALRIAEANPHKKVVFYGVGFETTSPTVAASILEAKKRGITNYLVLGVHKLIPPAMKALVDCPELNLDGFICPGHVSVIIGSQPYQFIPEQYHLPCVISGFEPLDILQSILMLVQAIEMGQAAVHIQYGRGVREEGNPVALRTLDQVFEVGDTEWRGLGLIPESGLKIRKEYRSWDAEEFLDLDVPAPRKAPGCLCGDILRGIKNPFDCPLFGGKCTPESPVGPCMVSSEGTCAAYYRYERYRVQDEGRTWDRRDW